MKAPDPTSDPNAFGTWSHAHTGLIVTKEKMLGSGILVQHENGYPAFLTAIHVVVQAILSREFAIALFAPTGTIVEPTAIRFAKGSDAALLSLERESVSAMLDHTEWRASGYADPATGKTVFCIGYPGEQSTPGDLATKKRGTVVGSAVGGIVQEGLTQGLVHVRTERGPELPKSFRGMSGGPVIGPGGELVGINTSELQDDPAIASIYYTRRSDWQDLAEAFRPPPEAQTDYLPAYPLTVRVKLGFRSPSTGMLLSTFTTTVFGRVLISAGNPDGTFGAVGFVDHMKIEGSRFPINVEAVYLLRDSKDRNHWNQEFKMECSSIFRTMGLETVDEEIDEDASLE
jgi:hypothetical protein